MSKFMMQVHGSTTRLCQFDAVCNKNKRSLVEWLEEVVDQNKMKDGVPQNVRDLIMRPTEEPAGIVEADDGSIRVIVERDKERYEMLWFEPGFAQGASKDGDVVLRNVYPMAVTYHYEVDEKVSEATASVEKLELVMKD